MTREEAIKTIRLTCPKISDSECDFETAMRFLIPELAESEDEKIRKWLIHEIEAIYVTDGIVKNENADKALAWLEKQKEQKLHLTVSGKEVYKICPRCKSRMIRDDSKIYTSMPPQYGYECPKCGEMEFDTVKYDNPEMEEQKPVDNEKVEMTDFEQSVYDLCPVLGIEEAKATASDILELAKETLLKTGKVVLASNYPEGCSFEDGFHLGYNEGFNAKQEQKPAEWSEEDKAMIESLIRHTQEEFDELCNDRYGHQEIISDLKESCRERMRWLEKLKSLRPSWKPSEDEERLINTSISFLKDFADKGYENAVECIDWLKSKLSGNSGK